MAYVASLSYPGKGRIITSRVIQGILAAAFVAAATAKLIGVPMMIQVFDAIGLGQWFRIVTALVEIGGAIALLTPGFAAFGALWLTVTMFFANRGICVFTVVLTGFATGAAACCPLRVAANNASAAASTTHSNRFIKASLRFDLGREG